MMDAKIGSRIRRGQILYEIRSIDNMSQRVQLTRLETSPIYEKYIDLLFVCGHIPELEKRLKAAFTDLPGISLEQLFYETHETYWLPMTFLTINGFTHLDHSALTIKV